MKGANIKRVAQFLPDLFAEFQNLELSEFVGERLVSLRKTGPACSSVLTGAVRCSLAESPVSPHTVAQDAQRPRSVAILRASAVTLGRPGRCSFARAIRCPAFTRSRIRFRWSSATGAQDRKDHLSARRRGVHLSFLESSHGCPAKPAFNV